MVTTPKQAAIRRADNRRLDRYRAIARALYATGPANPTQSKDAIRDAWNAYAEESPHVGDDWKDQEEEL